VRLKKRIEIWYHEDKGAVAVSHINEYHLDLTPYASWNMDQTDNQNVIPGNFCGIPTKEITLALPTVASTT
jgi:hypothetical protein